MRSRLRPFTAIMVLAGIAANANAEQQSQDRHGLSGKALSSIQPEDLDRHTEKLAEYRLNEVGEKMEKQLRSQSTREAKKQAQSKVKTTG